MKAILKRSPELLFYTVQELQHTYDYLHDLTTISHDSSCIPSSWGGSALLEALRSILDSLEGPVSVDALCVTGQMHGCVMIDENGMSIGNARLWCDARNQEEVGQW